MARVPAPRTVAASDDLVIKEAAWSSKTPELHPALVAKLRESWENKVQRGKTIETPAFSLACANPKIARERIGQLRQAAASLGIGVAIRVYRGVEPVNQTALDLLASDAALTVHFRARPKRGTSGSQES